MDMRVTALSDHCRLQAAERQKVSSRKMLTSLEIEFLASPISATISAVDALGSPPLISLLVSSFNKDIHVLW